MRDILFMKSVSYLQFDHNKKQPTNANKLVLKDIMVYSKELYIYLLYYIEALDRQANKL